MHTQPVSVERLRFRGDVADDAFVDWIDHRVRRLGIDGRIMRRDANEIEVLAAGPVELIDAMEMACSLGPISVTVDSVEREPSGTDRRA
ncbi:acylphosphatase [Oricola sp.]|uniref:acylphosphatase n=1 Tax=Oricola sp. TaxID=1979950 RepID=UPI003BAD1234